MLFLQSHNVSTGLAVKIYKQYGDDALGIVQSDPYRLARDIYGIGFITADKIAREIGIAQDAPERVAAGVAYALSQAADEGSVYLPAAELTQRSSELLGVSPSLVADGIKALFEAEQIWVEGEEQQAREHQAGFGGRGQFRDIERDSGADERRRSRISACRTSIANPEEAILSRGRASSIPDPLLPGRGGGHQPAAPAD